MKYPAALVLVIAGRVAGAEGVPERFRIGADVGYTLSDLHGGHLGLDGDLPLGRISLRARVEHGSLAPNGGGNALPDEMAAADAWRATFGLELRTRSREPGFGGFVGFRGGVMRISGGFLIDDTVYGGVGELELGIELRSELVRLRPAIGVTMWEGQRTDHLDRGLEVLVSGTLGVDVAF